MKLILAVTAASGAVYARQTAERLAALDCVESVALVYSDVAPTVMAHEGVALPDHPKFVRYDNRDLFLNECADLMYHYIVLLVAKGHTLQEVIEVLKERHHAK